MRVRQASDGRRSGSGEFTVESVQNVSQNDKNVFFSCVYYYFFVILQAEIVWKYYI